MVKVRVRVRVRVTVRALRLGYSVCTAIEVYILTPLYALALELRIGFGFKSWLAPYIFCSTSALLRLVSGWCDMLL